MLAKPVNYQHLTPLSFLTRTAQTFPDKDALVYRDRSWTYAQFAARVNQLASALQKWGLQKGDRVAFLCPNIPPMSEAHFAVPLAGGGVWSKVVGYLRAIANNLVRVSLRLSGENNSNMAMS